MKANFSTLKSLITLLFFSALISCQENPLEIDVSAIDIELNVKRFEQDLFSYPQGISTESVAELSSNYGLFFQDFTQSVINIGSPKNPQLFHQLNDFSKDPYIHEIKKDADVMYSNFSAYETEIKAAFKHYASYFPKKKIPQIITYISGFNYAITTDESYLGIGLDMFLGKDYPAYSQLGLPQYKTAFMCKEGLVAGAMLGWISTEFELKEKNADLLTEMIHQGKILYLLDALMPTAPHSLKISYTEEQLNWCENNEEPVWFYLIDNELLYTKETADLIKYMGEAPFIQGFPDGSPGRIGHWLGWQIVKAYMTKNPTITLEKLMLNDNAQQLLNASKYKP
jgi:gliding motility-associated lipoprotein GldB